MKCPYCSTEFDMETLKSYDDALQSEQINDMNWETPSNLAWQDGETDKLHAYICKSCGGEILGDDTTAATSCPFCGDPVVMMGKFSGVLRPDYIIPFKLDKKAAKEALTKHYGGKRLLPSIFKNQNHIDEVKGVYVPFWLFDAVADAHVRYKATKLRKWSDSNFNYTETSHYSVIRSGNITFEHVPVDGSTKMENDLMESIEPFEFSEVVDFQTAYLAGYLADKYNVDTQQSIERANKRIKKSACDSFAKTVEGYATVSPEASNVLLHNGKVKYALYPVWLLNTTWKGTKYTFAMNGQTGKLVGNLPLDKSAYKRWFFGIFAGASATIFGLFYILWLLM